MSEDDLDLSRAVVFTAQMMALIALANALVETGAANGEALIASLDRQMQDRKREGAQEKH